MNTPHICAENTSFNAMAFARSRGPITHEDDEILDIANLIKGNLKDAVRCLTKMTDALEESPEHFPYNGEKVLNDLKILHERWLDEYKKLSKSVFAVYIKTDLQEFLDTLQFFMEVLLDVEMYHVIGKVTPESGEVAKG